MSAFEVMGLRKYSRPEQSQKNNVSKSQSRHRGYLKDMLASRFLTRHKLEIQGPSSNNTRELEVKVQTLVTQEFEKFMKGENFNQKNLLVFEKGLLSKIRETVGDKANIRVREQTAPMTQRKHEIKTNH